jgi:hypothetical protein
MDKQTARIDKSCFTKFLLGEIDLCRYGGFSELNQGKSKMVLIVRIQDKVLPAMTLLKEQTQWPTRLADAFEFKVAAKSCRHIAVNAATIRTTTSAQRDHLDVELVPLIILKE